jgi:phage baseplate assembly protein W
MSDNNTSTQNTFETMAANVQAFVDTRVDEASVNLSDIMYRNAASLLQQQSRLSQLSNNDVAYTPAKTEDQPKVIIPRISQIKGMDAKTGATLSGIAHLRQSITNILTTYFGTRVMRREYGSKLFDLIDATGNKATIVKIYYAVAVALYDWEPRFHLTRVIAEDQTMSGKMSFTLFGEYLGQAVEVGGVTI